MYIPNYGVEVQSYVHWQLSKKTQDLTLDSILFLPDPNDIESAAMTGAMSRVASASPYPSASLSPPMTPTDNASFNYSNVSNMGRVRTSSITTFDPMRDVTKPKLKMTASDPLLAKK